MVGEGEGESEAREVPKKKKKKGGTEQIIAETDKEWIE